ncbi:MAG: hypothetical protein H6699_02140, partial [Myxococcales bacterium]|nr:hypothetical protein [Myxococcales bacterium]
MPASSDRPDALHLRRWLAAAMLALGAHVGLLAIARVAAPTPDPPPRSEPAPARARAARDLGTELPEPVDDEDRELVVEEQRSRRTPARVRTVVARAPAPPPETRPEVVPLPPPPPPPLLLAPVLPAPPSPPPEPAELRSVDQPDRGEEAPDEARYLAEHANRAEVETVSRTPTRERTEESDTARPDADEDVSEPNPTSDVPAPAPAPSGVAEERPDHSPGVAEPATASAGGPPDPGADASEGRRERTEGAATPRGVGVEVAPAASGTRGSGLDAFSLSGALERAARAASSPGEHVGAAPGGISAEGYVAMTGDGDTAAVEAALTEERRAAPYGDHEQRWERTREALENYDIEVAPGSETSLNTAASVLAPYIHRLHESIHPRWWAVLGTMYRAVGPMAANATDLSCELETVFNRAGEVVRVRIVRTSGSSTFDALAIDLMSETGGVT